MIKKNGIDTESPDYKPYSLIVNSINNFEEYRRVRTEEAYESLILGKSDMDSRRKAMRLNELDKNRRQTHNLALSSVNILNRMIERYGFNKLYNGPIMTGKDINDHVNLDARKDYTDFFFDILDTMESANIRELEQQYGDKKITPLREIQKNIDKTSRDYGVKSSLKKDDGDIEFNEERY